PYHIPTPLPSTLFPYTTLFRSLLRRQKRLGTPELVRAIQHTTRTTRHGAQHATCRGPVDRILVRPAKLVCQSRHRTSRRARKGRDFRPDRLLQVHPEGT